MSSKKNIWRAVFDIRPAIKPEGFNLNKLDATLNLKSGIPKKYKRVDMSAQKETETPSVILSSERTITIPANTPISNKRDLFLNVLERATGESLDLKVELAKVGGIIHEPTADSFLGFHRRKSILARVSKKNRNDINIDDIVAEIGLKPTDIIKPETDNYKKDSSFSEKSRADLAVFQSPNTLKLPENSPAGNELDFWLNKFKADGFMPDNRPDKLKNHHDFKVGYESGVESTQGLAESKPLLYYGHEQEPKRPHSGRKKVILLLAVVLVVVAVFFLIKFLSNGGLEAKTNVLQNSSNAVDNVRSAQKNLEEFDFEKAANNFALARDDFSRASKKLDEVGFSFLSFFVKLPGINRLAKNSFDKIIAINNLLFAGEDLAEAGESLSLGFSGIYKIAAPLLFGGFSDDGDSVSISENIDDFKEILVYAQQKIRKSAGLLSAVNPDVLPDENRKSFLDFKDKLPLMSRAVDDAISYSNFFTNLIGDSGSKVYLVLFQNNSELRATGGFPGSYALLTFNAGRLEKIFVDDIYNPDGQIKDKIIPPAPLSHIVYNWEARDANWFADFPLSAQKVSEFFKKGSGIDVDGVLTFTPDILKKMLEITGPIDMPEYGLALGADNFIEEVQREVEYGENRKQPKIILVDFQPRFLEKLKSQSGDAWMGIFKIIAEAVDEKKILVYFDDASLQNFAIKKNIAGEMKDPGGDFLSVVFSNVKGSKSDAVTDNFMDLSTALVDANIQHQLSINRIHGGGDSHLRFYNLPNPAYVRIYVPRGAILEEITGQDIVSFKPIVNYALEGYISDPDLARTELGTSRPFQGVDVFEESGKTVFGFWMTTNPKSSSRVNLKYSVKSRSSEGYSLYWQKQSGTIGDKNKINFSFQSSTGAKAVSAGPDLRAVSGYLVFNSDLAMDREININLSDK